MICQYPLRQSVSTTVIPHADIVYAPSTRLLAVAANHLQGLTIFNRGRSSPILGDTTLNHLSYCVDLHPNQPTIIAGTTDCTLELLDFAVVWCVYSTEYLKKYNPCLVETTNMVESEEIWRTASFIGTVRSFSKSPLLIISTKL